MQPGISMITLGVRDLQRSIAFYETGLGLPRMDAPPEVACFTLNGTWLGLFGRDDLAKDAGIDGASSGFAGFSLAHNVDSELEVDQKMAQAAAAGAFITKTARKTEWGGYAGCLPTLRAAFGRSPTILCSGSGRLMSPRARKITTVNREGVLRQLLKE